MSARTPQELLDMLQAINIQSIYASPASNKDAAKLVRQHLKVVKSELRDAQKYIGSQYDGRDSYQKQKEDQALEPYRSIETLIDKLETRNVELDTVGTREPLQFGNLVYGESGYWRIGSQVDAKIWTVKREYAIASSRLNRELKGAEENITKEKNDYETAVVAAKKNVEDLIKDYQIATTNLKRSQKQFSSGRIWFVIILVIGVAAIVAIDRLAGNDSNLMTINHTLVGFVVVCFLGYVGYNGLLNPMSSIRSLKTKLPILHKAAEDAKNNYKPTLIRLKNEHESKFAALNLKLEEIQQHAERAKSEFDSQIQQLEAQRT